jgi:hypothetical protein
MAQGYLFSPPLPEPQFRARHVDGSHAAEAADSSPQPMPEDAAA